MAMEGYIFGCGDDTIGECFARGLFGLPYKYRNQVEAILPGTPLYLFHFQQRVCGTLPVVNALVLAHRLFALSFYFSVALVGRL